MEAWGGVSHRAVSQARAAQQGPQTGGGVHGLYDESNLMKQTPSLPDLSEDDLTPLLQATASRSLDTCLRGARGLAVLGDPRAFGLLLQLSREQDPAARVEVCRALAALEDPRAADRLRSLLY